MEFVVVALDKIALLHVWQQRRQQQRWRRHLRDSTTTPRTRFAVDLSLYKHAMRYILWLAMETKCVQHINKFNSSNDNNNNKNKTNNN